jgi:5-methylcytosine-specific restriction enzyme subunit McrC
VACNTVHKERFYTDAAEYDSRNDWNEILFAALKATGRTAQSGLLRSRAKNLSLHFPDWSERRFDATDFDQLMYDRKTTGYKQAITLARLILLDLNPQIASGQEKVVALLFDMNRLWEEWLLATYRSSYRHDSTVQVLGKKKQRFWESEHGNKVVETDILIKRGEQYIILDAKWKTPGPLPSDDELKQMFAYNLTWASQESWLVYPQVNADQPRRGKFVIDAAGHLGMEFVNILENNRLRQSVPLPVTAEPAS